MPGVAAVIHAFLAASLPAAAQSTNGAIHSDRPFLAASLAKEGPMLDGKLDDPVWLEAEPLTNFTQVIPIEGAAPSERTEVRFVYTPDYLYVGVRCFDSQPARIIAKQMQRDSGFDSDDFITIAFDSFGRHRDGYFFSVNPVGTRTDGLIQNFSDERFEWDALWEVRARIDEQGWTAELAIPFKSLSFDPHRESWGGNVQRTIRRRQEIVRWTALSSSKGVTTLSDFGEVRGLTGLRQGLGLELRPFVSAKYRENSVSSRSEWKLKPGGDLTYRITPSLTANATINTDFAEAEVDERVVNLTRFPTFFPEKRDFFLQDSSLFSFGGLNRELIPFYSRRIGLSADGKPVDIIGGGRLTGRVGATQIAMLDVQQEAHGELDSKNLFAGRISTRVLEESNVGLIATHGDPRNPGENTLLGFDFNYLNSRLPEDKELIGHAWVMGTDSERFQSRDAAFGAELRYPNEPFSLSVQTYQVGDEFDPALGFVDRRGIRDYNAMGSYRWRPNTDCLRSIELWSRWEYVTDLDNRIVAEHNDIVNLEFENPAGDEFEISYGFDRDVVDEAFDLPFILNGTNVMIPAGDYWDGHVLAEISTSSARPVSGRVEYRYGGFYKGYEHQYEANLDWRPSRHFSSGVDYEMSRIRMFGEYFHVHVVTWRLNLGLTPDLTWRTLVQYDNLSDEVGLNSRIRWTWKPGNDVFFVVNQGWELAAGRFVSLQREITLKVGATFRF